MSARLDYQAISPAGVKALGGVYAYVLQSGLDVKLVELVFLRVSQINGCAYCIDMHTHELIGKGVANQKIALLSVWREAGALFDAREKAALRWGEAVTQVTVGGIPEEDYQSVTGLFSEKETVDLTIAVGLMNTFNRMAIAFRKQPQFLSAKVA